MITLVYLDTNDSILLKANDATFKVLHIILNQSDDEGTWYADKVHKQEIMSKLNITITTLDKHIASLKNRELINKEVRGRYKLNEEIFTI